MPTPPRSPGADYFPPHYSSDEIRALSIKSVHFRDHHVLFLLSDGKALCVPLSVSPLLEAASQEERYQWQLLEQGRVVAWDTETLQVHLDLSWLLKQPEAMVAELAGERDFS
jgi:uncharacterized protein DUF2442